MAQIVINLLILPFPQSNRWNWLFQLIFYDQLNIISDSVYYCRIISSNRLIPSHTLSPLVLLQKEISKLMHQLAAIFSKRKLGRGGYTSVIGDGPTETLWIPLPIHQPQAITENSRGQGNGSSNHHRDSKPTAEGQKEDINHIQKSRLPTEGQIKAPCAQRRHCFANDSGTLGPKQTH